MDELNKLETVPTVDALVEEDSAVKIEVVEPVIEPAPTPEPEAKPVAPKIIKEDGVVLYSLKDISTESGLSISKGYSKVSIANANELLGYKSVRKASAEEIKVYFNK